MTIVITGASQGIGRAVARAYADAASGVRLALLARSRENLEAVADECRARGAEAAVFVSDVTDEAQVARAAGAAQDAFGAADVLVNNAGVFTPGSFLEITPEAFRRQVEVNLHECLPRHARLPARNAGARGLWRRQRRRGVHGERREHPRLPRRRGSMARPSTASSASRERYARRRRTVASA